MTSTLVPPAQGNPGPWVTTPCMDRTPYCLDILFVTIAMQRHHHPVGVLDNAPINKLLEFANADQRMQGPYYNVTVITGYIDDAPTYLDPEMHSNTCKGHTNGFILEVHEAVIWQDIGVQPASGRGVHRSRIIWKASGISSTDQVCPRTCNPAIRKLIHKERNH